MSKGDLFDLPSEEEDDDGPWSPGDRPGPNLRPSNERPSAEQSTRPGGPRDTTGVSRGLETSGGSAPTADLPPGTRRALTVTDLRIRVRDLLETEFFEVWVEGELSNCRHWNTGHMYFTLKDSSAQVKGVIFRSALRYLKFKPADGMHVVARGRVTVYEPKGEYQIVCEHLEPQGVGALQLAFDQLKKRLQQEGLFDAARKRALPALPRKIGIVTALDGAAIQDIIKVLRRRHANVHLIIRPARVQGEDAALEIATGIRAIGRVPGVDVVIVGRGGGSIEDLWAFNEEIVARAIARCPVPVISAVGHETDITIADFVADLRAPTPSAAAEIVVAAKSDLSARIDRLRDRARAAVHARMQTFGRRLHMLESRPAFAGLPGRVVLRGRHALELSHAIVTAIRIQLGASSRRLQQLQRRLEQCDLARRLGAIQTRLLAADAHLSAAVIRRRHIADTRLRGCASRLEALSPLAVLGRGYAVCWNADRTAVIRDWASASQGDHVRVTLARGELDCEVRASHD